MDTSNLHLLYEAHTLVARAGGGGNSTDPNRPPVYKAVGLTLAVASGLLIGSSFVLKKTGLLRANEKYNEEAGEGYGYLKNVYWWAGMTLMILGEVCNFVAYAFVDAILVTPLGALSVVVTTILSAIFLKERLSFVGKIGCFNCIIGSIIIVMNAPEQSAVADIQEMKDFVIHPGFLTYAGLVIVGCLGVIIWVAPKYGKKSMLVYLTICSLIGGLSVVATQGLGSAIVAQAGGKPQFNQWFLYVLLVFVVATLLTEIIYLNKALNLFNAALVTPTYYVIFTTATIVTSAILFRGFHGTPISIATVIMGFLQICAGVVLLQLSKSAKDVPDAAVFKGDLDQMREVAEQEQPETEPKADAIRGTAAIIRRISQSRAKMEHNEFRRLHNEKQLDHLEPLKENEVVEWDGLRRRKTIIGNESTPNTPIVRRKTIHPPLGMSHFPDDSSDTDDRDRAHTDAGIMSTIRYRASSIFHPFSPRTPARDQPQSPMHPVALTDIQVHPSKTDSPIVPYSLGDNGEPSQEHIYGLPAGLRQSSRSMKPVPSPRSKPLPDYPEPSPTRAVPHGGGARRQFSFNNFLGRQPRPATPIDGADELPLPPSRSGLGSRGNSYSHEQKKAMKNATEEERLGLVKGDSHHALLESSPERAPHALQSIPSRPRSNSSSSNSMLQDDSVRYGQYSYNPRTVSQSQSRGHDNIHYARTRNASDSDGDDDWQITTPPTDSNAINRLQPQAHAASDRNPVPSLHLNPQQSQRQRPSSRKRPSPPRHYQPPTISPFTIFSSHNPTNPTLAEAIPYLGQGSHSRTTSSHHSGATLTGPQVLTDSSHSQSSSTNLTHIRVVSQDQGEQEPVRGWDQDLRTVTIRQEVDDNNNVGSNNLMRRAESPEAMQETNMELDTSAASKKRFELQSARERDERRKRMSTSWSNPTTPTTGSNAPGSFV